MKLYELHVTKYGSRKLVEILRRIVSAKSFVRKLVTQRTGRSRNITKKKNNKQGLA